MIGAAAVATVSCSGPVPVDQGDQSSSPVGADFFTEAGNIWNSPVPANAPVDPRSASYVARLEGLDPVISIRKFSVPVYMADASTPRFTITPTAAYAAPGTRLASVPIPAGATADPSDDGHLAVLDPGNKCVYELYRAQPRGSGWTAEWVNATPSDGTGVYPDGLGTRAAGFSIAAGLIWPDELRSGKIDHALVFAYPFTRKGGPVAPATRSDGRTDDPTALPIGSRMILDPSIDVDALGLSPQDLTIAHTLQRYGMFLADTSGGFTLYAVNPQSFPADPYSSLWGQSTWADISKIPFDRMQVLDSGPSQAPYTGPPIANRCTMTG